MKRFENMINEIKMKQNGSKDLEQILGISGNKISKMRKKKYMSIDTLTHMIDFFNRKKDKIIILFHFLTTKHENLIKKLEKKGGYEYIIKILKLDQEINEMIRKCILEDVSLKEIEDLTEVIRIFCKKNND